MTALKGGKRVMKQKIAYYKTLQVPNIGRLCLLSEDIRKPYPHTQQLNVPPPHKAHIPKNTCKQMIMKGQR